MPDLEGLTMEDAQIKARPLTVRLRGDPQIRKTRDRTLLNQTRVLSQDPEAGAKVGKDSTVLVQMFHYVMDTPPPDTRVRVPGLKGYPLDRAELAVAEQGLKLRYTIVNRPEDGLEVESTVVTDQAPEKGTLVARGETVTVTFTRFIPLGTSTPNNKPPKKPEPKPEHYSIVGFWNFDNIKSEGNGAILINDNGTFKIFEAHKLTSSGRYTYTDDTLVISAKKEEMTGKVEWVNKDEFNFVVGKQRLNFKRGHAKY